MSNTKLWPSCTGTIVRMEKRQGPKADFVSLTLECVSKDGETSFRRDAIAFDNENETLMSDLLAIGKGARIFVRGPQRTVTRETEGGTKFRQTTMTIRSFKEKPLEDVVADDTPVVADTDVAEAAVETATAVAIAETVAVEADADAIPALPEGASEITHALYTKKDGSKAWRKRPASQIAKAQAEAEAPAAVEAQAEAPVEAPATVVAKADAPRTNVLDSVANAGEDTAMAAALKAAIAA